MNENIESDVKAVQGLTMLKFSWGCVSEEESHTHTHTHTHAVLCAQVTGPRVHHPFSLIQPQERLHTHPLRQTHTLSGRHTLLCHLKEEKYLMHFICYS